MELFDDFGSTFVGLVGQVQASALPQLLGAVLKKSEFGDLQTLVNRLQQGGLTQRVESWVGQQPASPVSSSEIIDALGKDQVDGLSQAFGLTPQSTVTLLASNLPKTVSEASRIGLVKVHASPMSA
jgi:uncharacterized protein YidB (DUF937 family)